MSDDCVVCGVCEYDKEILAMDRDGGSPVKICEPCLAELDFDGDGCSICGVGTNGKYQIVENGETLVGGELCMECRKRVVFTKQCAPLAARLVDLGATRFLVPGAIDPEGVA